MLNYKLKYPYLSASILTDLINEAGWESIIDHRITENSIDQIIHFYEESIRNEQKRFKNKKS